MIKIESGNKKLYSWGIKDPLDGVYKKMTENNKPVHTEREGTISASMFQDGKKFTLNLQKSYKKDDAWVNKSITLFLSEIDKVKRVIELMSITYHDEIKEELVYKEKLAKENADKDK